MLMQLNREHTYELRQLVRSVNGEMSISDALNDPKGAGLVNFLGKGEISAIDMPVSPIRLVQGDKIILMSDGVYNALTDDELTEALAAPTEQAALNVRSAVAAKNFSNQDNYTAVIIGYGA
jgi:serine/threonine protein phosphatase PrpC